MTKTKSKSENSFLLFSLFTSACISGLILLVWLIYPLFISSNYYQKSLHQLRNKSEAIKREFASVVQQVLDKHDLFKSPLIPQQEEQIYDFFNQFQINKNEEGIAYYNESKQLKLWSGRVIDIQRILIPENQKNIKDQQTLLIKHKASVYLTSIHRTKRGSCFVLTHLLAFLPQFKAQYLQEYHFLKDKFMSNCKIDYWDFREDISGFERIFQKYDDEYIGQPRLQNEIQTIFFPLRNEQNRIIATVTLSSPPLSSLISVQKQNILLGFYCFLVLSLILLLAYIIKYPPLSKHLSVIQKSSVILILISIRFIFLPLSRLGQVQSLSVFSPSTASFVSINNLTKSPADIFLTSLLLASLIGFLLSFFRQSLNTPFQETSLSLGVFSFFLSSSISILLLHVLYKLIHRLAFNTNQVLLNLSLKPSYFLMHLSLLLFIFSFLALAYAAMKKAALYSQHKVLSVTVLLAVFCVYALLMNGKISALVFAFQGAVLLILLVLVSFPAFRKRKEALLFAFVIVVLFIHSSLHLITAEKKKEILESSLKNIVTSQEDWALFLIQESIQEINENQNQVVSFFKNQKPQEISTSLWKRTLIAKFNWYSSLEMLDSKGNIASRFSLNIPNLQTGDDPPFSENWTIIRQSIPFLGEEKDFFTGYKDWLENDQYLGRTILSLSVGYEMLPFLYSANPYFELTRATSIPSLQHINLGFAVFDSQGKLLFNPNHISKGLSPSDLQQIQSSKQPIWSVFSDKGKDFQCLYFEKEDSIYSLFIPKKNFMTHSVEILILFFLYLVFVLLSGFIYYLIFYYKKIKNPFWSFSNRVYLSFIAVSIIPLLLFSVLTRGFFSQIFTQKLTEEAEVQAQFAHSIIEDLAFFQQEEQLTVTIPSDEMVMWISSTISNDVNLYAEGKLVSSSHREFFDYGILPELIDGDIYYQARYENNPFYTQTQKIGEYSFHTLTVPYEHNDNFFLISLPLPLEQEEISAFSYELFEFLVFISFFFIIAVLILARGIGGMILNPIQRLLSGTKEVSLGNLEVCIHYEKQDEMKTLINGFNTMVQSLRKHQQELADISKKIAWAEMARKVAHEIKNPLTPIQLSAEHLMKVYEDDREDFEKTLKESTSYIVNEVENLRKIALDFLDTSKIASLKKETLNLKQILRETISPYQSILSERIQFKESYQKEALIFSGDKAKLKTVIRNLLTNAIESIKGKGEVEIKALSSKENIHIEMIDSGAGVKKQVLDTIFEPYYSTKKEGTGLGLPIAKKIIEEHKGNIKASLNKPTGMKISITLPKTE
ncbi:MAG: HAMP domain-containing protein [Candidatus Aminicenantes bacterium]|nr:HAMP domain-containing protein [Candidatus Aminicenantes bacterium]